MAIEMKQIYGNDSYKVLKLALASGETMPRHFAASDAFIIVKTGRATVNFQDRSTALAPGDTLHIPAREPHSLLASEDFNAIVIF